AAAVAVRGAAVVPATPPVDPISGGPPVFGPAVPAGGPPVIGPPDVPGTGGSYGAPPVLGIPGPPGGTPPATSVPTGGVELPCSRNMARTARSATTPTAAAAIWTRRSRKLSGPLIRSIPSYPGLGCAIEPPIPPGPIEPPGMPPGPIEPPNPPVPPMPPP